MFRFVYRGLSKFGSFYLYVCVCECIYVQYNVSEMQSHFILDAFPNS